MRLAGKIIFLFFLLTFRLSAQSSVIEWQTSIGGSDDEISGSIKQTKDRGYILTGYTASNDGDIPINKGDNDCLIVKLDSAGKVQWKKCFGGSGDDRATDILEAADGGYIFTGFTKSSDGDVKLNKGGFDIWIVKINSAGILQWEKTYGGLENEVAYAMAQTPDGGYIVTGGAKSADSDVTNPKGAADVWVLKVNSTGVLSWQKSYGGSLDEWGTGIKSCTGGNYIVSAVTQSADGDVFTFYGAADVWVLLLDSVGKLQWQKSLGGSNFDQSTCVIQTKEGGFLVGAITISNDIDVTHSYGSLDLWVVKLTNTGKITWQRSIGGTQIDWPASIIQNNKGKYIVLGSVQSDEHIPLYGEEDIWLLQLDTTGAIEWQRNYGGTSYELPSQLCQTHDGGLVIFGSSYSSDIDLSDNKGFSDYWVFKLSPDEYLNFDESVTTSLSVFPNPCEGVLNIANVQQFESIEITDQLGNIVLDHRIQKADEILDVSQIGYGVFVVQLKGKKTFRQKIIRVR